MGVHIREKKDVTVGNPQIYEEYRAKFSDRESNNQSALTISASLDETKMPVVHDFITGVDVNSDGYEDVIEGRSYRVGTGDAKDPFRWVVFTSVYFGDPVDNLLSVPLFADHPNLIYSSEQRAEPEIATFEMSAMQMLSLDQDTLDRSVAEGTHSVMAFAYDSLSYFWLLKVIDVSRAEEAVKADVDLRNYMRREFQFAIGPLERWVDKEVNPLASKCYENMILEIEGKHETHEAAEIPGYFKMREMWSVSDETLVANSPKDELYNQLFNVYKAENNPADTAMALRKRGAFISWQKGQGGLFDDGPTGFVSQANAYAKGQGYKDYAELRLQRMNGFSPDEYENLTLEILQQNKPLLEEAVAEAHAKGRVVGDKTYWDILEKKRLEELRKIGVTEEPTFSVAEVMEIIEQFLNDVGIYKNRDEIKKHIIFDIYRREGKDNDDSYVEIKGGSTMVIFNGYEKDQRLDMESLAVALFHELGHAINYTISAESAGGSYFGSASFASIAVVEGIAEAFGQLIYTREWLDRYASKYPQFKDPRVREIISRSYQEWNAYWVSVRAARALWEINLYRNQDVDEVLDWWGQMGVEYLGYSDTGIPTSKVSYYNLKVPHPGMYPLYYSAYEGAFELTEDIKNDFRSALAVKDPSQLKKAFEKTRQLFLKSSFLNSVKTAKQLY